MIYQEPHEALFVCVLSGMKLLDKRCVFNWRGCVRGRVSTIENFLIDRERESLLSHIFGTIEQGCAFLGISRYTASFYGFLPNKQVVAPPEYQSIVLARLWLQEIHRTA